MYSTLLKLLLFMTTAFALVAAAGCQANKKLVTSFSNDLATTPTLDDSFLKITNPLDCEDACVPESSFELDSISPNALADYKSISY